MDYKINLKIKSNLIFIIVFIVFFQSCTISDELSPKDSYSYYPIQIGDYKIYKIKTIKYAANEKPLVDSSFTKEIVKKVSIDFNGNEIYTIEKQSSKQNGENWVLESNYQIIKNLKQIVSNINNNYTVILAFPVYNGAVWNANSFKTKNEVKVKLSSRIFEIPNKTLKLEAPIKIVENDNKSLIDLKKNYWIFDKNIGLVYQENTNLEYDQQQIGKDIIQSGSSFSQELLSFGSEK